MVKVDLKKSVAADSDVGKEEKMEEEVGNHSGKPPQFVPNQLSPFPSQLLNNLEEALLLLEKEEEDDADQITIHHQTAEASNETRDLEVVIMMLQDIKKIWVIGVMFLC